MAQDKESGKVPHVRSDVSDPYIHFDLRNARASAGYTMAQVAEEAGVSTHAIASYERLRAIPNPLVARRIARYLGKEVRELFPPQLKEIVHEIQQERKGYSEPQTVSLEDVSEDQLLSEDDPAVTATQDMLRSRINEVLKTLTFRERDLLKQRYGIGDGYTYTLEEVGRIFKVTRDRIRQVEAKAISKLQHPVRRGRNLSFYTGNQAPDNPKP
jgi:RNA polymerase primary sigma factor